MFFKYVKSIKMSLFSKDATVLDVIRTMDAAIIVSALGFLIQLLLIAKELKLL